MITLNSLSLLGFRLGVHEKTPWTPSKNTSTFQLLSRKVHVQGFLRKV